MTYTHIPYVPPSECKKPPAGCGQGADSSFFGGRLGARTAPMRGIEADNPVRGDFHLFPCSRIAALAAFPPDNVQRPDAVQDAPLALGKPFLQTVQHCADKTPHTLQRQAVAHSQDTDEFTLRHVVFPLLFENPTLVGTAFVFAPHLLVLHEPMALGIGKEFLEAGEIENLLPGAPGYLQKVVQVYRDERVVR